MTITGDDPSIRPIARRIEVFTGAGQRRRWSAEDKAAVVAQSHSGVGTVSEVARRHGLASSQLFAWRRDARLAAEAGGASIFPATSKVPSTFVPVVIEPVPGAPVRTATSRRRRAAPAAVEIEIDGVSVRIARGTEPRTIAAVIRALKAGR